MFQPEVEKFWDTCDKNFAHITLSRHLPGYKNLSRSWERDFVSKINFKDKVVLDYGIGAGYLGKYLFEKKGIKKYIGVDISERSLENAKKILKPWQENVQLIHVKDITNFEDFDVDVFVSQACIQHFPNEEYLIHFLQKVNKCNAPKLMLQIRHNKDTIFNGTDYKDMVEVCGSCKTNKNFALKYLENYKVVYESRIARNNYQFLIFDKLISPSM